LNDALPAIAIKFKLVIKEYVRKVQQKLKIFNIYNHVWSHNHHKEHVYPCPKGFYMLLRACSTRMLTLN
jgi:hypothetical protein